MLRNIFTRKKLMRLFFLGIATVAYYALFAVLEDRKVPTHTIHTRIDDMIPFCQYFIIPYFMWFAYVVGTIVYFGAIKDNDYEFKKLFSSMVIGIASFLIICMVYPNGLHLRPKIMGDDICSQLVLGLYRTDTPTNVLPSLHVYNSIVCLVAIFKSEYMKNRRFVKVSALVLSISIILSTMFLKQHSIIDVTSALLLNFVVYHMVYGKKMTYLEKYESVTKYFK